MAHPNGNGTKSRNGHANRVVGVETTAVEQPPPYNIEAEQGVLGGILWDNQELPRVIDKLRVEDFYRDSHQIIYRAIRSMYDEGTPVDYVLLSEELNRRGEFEKIGGVEALVEIQGSVPHAANTQCYAQIVKDKAVQRVLIESAYEILRDGYSNTFTADQLSERALASIEAIDAGPSKGGESLDTVLLSDVTAEPIEWIWPGKIAAGMLNMFVGDPGIGKTTAYIAVSAAITTRGTLPGMEGESVPDGSVVLLAAEDSLAQTVRPRFELAGGDLSRVEVVRMVRRGKRRRTFSLADDLDMLEQVITRRGDVRVLVIDPVTSYLKGIDAHKGQDVRGMLHPLAEMAERHRFAVLMIGHFSKGSGAGKAMYRSADSIAFVAAARCAWAFTRDGKDPSGARRLITPMKTNVVADPTGLAFRIVDGRTQFEADPIRMTADQALANEAGPEAERAGGISRPSALEAPMRDRLGGDTPRTRPRPLRRGIA